METLQNDYSICLNNNCNITVTNLNVRVFKQFGNKLAEISSEYAINVNEFHIHVLDTAKLLFIHLYP